MVKFKQSVSDPLHVGSGVPQGSILGPLLFIIFMNDMALEPEDTELDMYADDSTLGASGKDIASIEVKLNVDMKRIENWCEDNRMVINTDKTKSMLITTYQRFNKLPVTELQIWVNDQELQNVKVEKLLGVCIDQNLSWKAHTDKVFKTVSMVLARFRGIKPYLPTEARIKFCQAFVFPHLDYCSCIWGSAQIDSTRLFKLQKRAACMIYDLPTRTPTEPLLKKLKWMPLMDCIQYMVYKSLNDLTPQYMKDLYQYVHTVSSRSTRNSDRTKLYLAPKNNLKVFTDSFHFSSAEAWNKLPAHVRECGSIGAFKTAYFKWYATLN